MRINPPESGRFVGGRRVAPRVVATSGQQPGRALVVLQAAPSERSARPTGRVYAPFLAQLIATDMQVPQARVRRRASAEEAATAYAAAHRLIG